MIDDEETFKKALIEALDKNPRVTTRELAECFGWSIESLKVLLQIFNLPEHELLIQPTRYGDTVELRCKCGWEEDLGACTTPDEIIDLANEHLKPKEKA